MSNTASYIGKEPTYGVFITQSETGDGSTVAFTLTSTASTTASLLVSVGGVVQQPAVAYNVNSTGTTLTFTGAPESGDAIWILYLGQTLTVPQASSANTTMITGESALGTAPAAGDYFLLYDADAAAMKKVAYSNLETGDITDVVAGAGMTGGGTTGAVTLNAIGGTGITVNANDITIDATVATLAGTQSLTNKTLTSPVMGGTMTGTIGGFRSTGIDDNADALAITIDSAEKVGIGTTTPDTILHAEGATETTITAKSTTASSYSRLYLGTDNADNASYLISYGSTHGNANKFAIKNGYGSIFFAPGTSGTATEKMTILSGGDVGLGTNTPTKQLHITKSAAANLVALSDGTNISVDFDNGQNFTVTLAGNRTLDNPTNVTAGQTGSIFVTQDGTGSRTLSYGTSWEFPAATAPTLTTTAAAVDRIDYIVKSATSIQAVATLAYA